MPKAIETKFYRPTRTLPARIRAKGEGKSIFFHYDGRLDNAGNHRAAAAALADSMGMGGRWEMGWLKGRAIHVFTRKRKVALSV